MKSQYLELVLQPKAFSGNPVRSYLHESILKLSDYAILVFFTVFFLAAIFLFIFYGVGTFGCLI